MEGKSLGERDVTQELVKWVMKRLSRHKWLTGGVEVVDEVCCCSHPFGNGVVWGSVC